MSFYDSSAVRLDYAGLNPDARYELHFVINAMAEPIDRRGVVTIAARNLGRRTLISLRGFMP